MRSGVKQRACKVCREKFEPVRPMQTTCSIPCAIEYGRQQLAKKQAKEAKAERAQDKVRREKLKTRTDWIKEAQAAFNKFIRLRDAEQPCICCGKPLTLVAPLDDDGNELEGGWHASGGDYDCGHWRSVGSAPHLRFDERNAHAQRKQCNRWGAGRAVDYRRGLAERLGIEVVEALEADQTPRKWTVDELKALRDEYRAKAKALEAA
jgi:hypothetical protein